MVSKVRITSACSGSEIQPTRRTEENHTEKQKEEMGNKKRRVGDCT